METTLTLLGIVYVIGALIALCMAFTDCEDSHRQWTRAPYGTTSRRVFAQMFLNDVLLLPAKTLLWPLHWLWYASGSVFWLFKDAFGKAEE